MAEALLSEYLGDAVLGHPGLMAVPETVGSKPLSDTGPAGKRCVRGREFPAAGAVAGTGLVSNGAPVEAQRHRVPARWQWPVPSELTSRAMPFPDGGINGYPATA